MKILSILVLLLSLGLAHAQDRYFVSPSQPSYFDPENAVPPRASQSFNVWKRLDCNFIQDNSVVINDSDRVRVFLNAAQPGICPSPLPPIMISLAEVNGLGEGDYTLVVYLIPFGDTFPPEPSNYPTYEVQRSQFGVIGAPAAVNSITNLGVITLLILVLVFGFFANRNQ